MVVASHTVLCFCRYMVLPRSSDNGPYYFFQLPIARLPAQGQAWVAVFFVLLGFVNPLKTISQCRSGEYSSALTYLAANSFKRLGRLIFPAATMTVLAWFACQLGFLNLSLHSEAYWLRITSANPSENWVQAIDDLLKALVSTWFYADNPYDQPQWALPYLFKGSIFVFITLLTTCRATPRFRMLAYTVLYIWSWSIGECMLKLFSSWHWTQTDSPIRSCGNERILRHVPRRILFHAIRFRNSNFAPSPSLCAIPAFHIRASAHVLPQ